MNEAASSLVSVPNSIGCVRNAQKNILKVTQYLEKHHYSLLASATNLYFFFQVISNHFAVVVRGPQNFAFPLNPVQSDFCP